MKTKKLCKFCGKINKTKRSEFCSFNCYQKYRYQNSPEVREKVKKATAKSIRDRYKTDKEFRKKAIEYSRIWQKKHKERVREIARDWKRKQKELSKSGKIKPKDL